MTDFFPTRAAVGLVGMLAALSCAAQGMSTSAQPSPWASGLYADARAEAWSNGVPVMDLDGAWTTGYRRRSGDQRAYASVRGEVGMWLAGPRWPQAWGEPSGLPLWRLGAVGRLDASAVMAGDAAEVLRLYQQGQDPAQPAVYDTRTRMRLWQGRGLALHATTPRWAGWSLDLGWDAMNLQRLRSLQTQGTVAYQADGSYAYAGTLHDDDSRYQALYMAAPARSGQGAALSVGLNWVAGEDAAPWWPSRGSLQVDDAWSRLSWQGVNGNDAVLNSQVQTRDAQGRVTYNAAIQGRYTRRTLVERIPVRTALQLDWAQPSGRWSLQVVERVGLWQRWLVWQGPWAIQPMVGLDPVAHAWRAGLAWQGLQLAYTSGMGDGAQRIRGLTLAMSWPLGTGTPR